MKIFLNNTREYALCKDLSAQDLRVWAGILSMVDEDLIVPPKAMIGKQCGIPTTRIKFSLRALTYNGFLMDTWLSVNPRYISLTSKGQGSTTFHQESLKEIARNRTLHSKGLKLFYYLLGDIRQGSRVYDTNLASICRIMGSSPHHAVTIVAQLEREGFITINRSRVRRKPFGRKYFYITEKTLGTRKRI